KQPKKAVLTYFFKMNPVTTDPKIKSKKVTSNLTNKKTASICFETASFLVLVEPTGVEPVSKHRDH
ncbi:hypothetical protein, partial [Sediminibacterium sp.]|uniref:hypothetical protein n=1 Tax=Sediminibacterium sp. TaxID=1917865 RepID=UPI0027302B2F